MSNQLHPNLKHLIAACAIFALTAVATQASVLDLGSSGTGYLGGAYFSTTDIQPTGTGVFDPFLTIQASPTEQGYNSGTGNFDTKREPQWNHEILFSDLRATTINGIDYYGFVIDVNEPNGHGQERISLDSLQIWVSPTLQSSTSTDGTGNFNGSLGTLVFDLGSGNTLKYTDGQNGSGSGDINVFIPVSAFAGAASTDYIYMYQGWGNADMSEGGFEETALLGGFVPVPELSTFFPVIGLLVAVFSTHALRRRKLMQMARQESR